MDKGHPSRRLAVAVAASATFLGSQGAAQMHHVDAPARVTRAVGVYEWTGDLSHPTAARFVPVSLFIDGSLEDAGLYLARPVPLALEPGDVYALERAGEPQGLLDLDLARRVVTGKALADDDPEGTWYGYGKYKADLAPPAPHLHPTAHLSDLQGTGTPPGNGSPGADGAGGAPHLDRRPAGADGASQAGTGATNPAGADGSQGGSATASSTADTASSDDDQDRPTLRRRDPAEDARRRREGGKSSRQASVTAAGPALGADPDRPFLGRAPEADTGPEPLTGLPADMHQAVGVSDATHDDAHPFARAWESPTEKTATLAALEALARPHVLAYLAANDLAPSDTPLAPLQPAAIPGGEASAAAAPATAPGSATGNPGAPPQLERGIPQAYQSPTPLPPAGAGTTPTGTPAGDTAPAPSAAGNRTASSGRLSTHSNSTHPHGTHPGGLHHPATTPPVPLVFAQPEVAGYTLSYGGLPTFVFTAAASARRLTPADRAHPAPLPGSPSPAVYVTVVAQRLPSGQLQTNLLSVTDSTHLDRSPRLRLVDAVDPDDSHRASLLFELRGASSRQFALYRLTTVEAEQTFATASIE